MPQDFWDDHDAHLKDLPDHVLFDVARNDSAQRAYRRRAVEILVNRKSPRVQHPDLADLVAELEIELDGIQFEHPAPSGSGPLVASVTTETMFSDGSPEVLVSTNAETPSNTETKSKKPKKVPKPDAG